MSWVENLTCMPRIVQIVILSLFSICAAGQRVKLSGKYSAFFIGSETIQFAGRDSFYFSGFYCNYGYGGKGRYEIRDDLLHLYFERSGRKKKSETVSAHLITRLSESETAANVYIESIYSQQWPLSSITVEAIFAGRPLESVMADSNGRAKLVISNRVFPITVRFTALGLQTEEIKIDSAANYSLKVFHRQHQDWPFTQLNKGQQFIFEIQKLSVDTIKMRRAEGNGDFYEYIKEKLNPKSSTHSPY
jgi:hypothetical protein